MAKRKAETLADLVDEKGLGLRDLAKLAKVGRQSLWRWIHGHAEPRIPQQKALADALGVPIAKVRAAVMASRGGAGR